MKEKVCIKCGGKPQPIENFYFRPDNGKRLNTCKTCRIAQQKERDNRKEIKQLVVPVLEDQKAIHCNKCDNDKPENEFTKRPDRPGHYTTCKECKNRIEKERRKTMPKHERLFDEALFSGIF